MGVDERPGLHERSHGRNVNLLATRRYHHRFMRGFRQSFFGDAVKRAAERGGRVALVISQIAIEYEIAIAAGGK